jgi:hypothetical protein
MATSALAAKKAVYAILEASLTGEPVGVTYGAVKSPERSWAFVTRVTYSDSKWAAVGARTRSESYDVGVVFSIIQPGGSCESVETEALRLLDMFEDGLRADPTLGGIAVAGAALVPKEIRSQPVTDGAECEWTGAVRITEARI